MPFIDWTFFFTAWELKGRYPAILDHPQYGTAARDLYDSAQALLDRIVSERLLTARGVYGFWPAASEGDDIVVYRRRSARGELARFNMLRQQEIDRRRQAEPVAGRLRRAASSGGVRTDYLGAFAVTAGHRRRRAGRAVRARARRLQRHLVKALADRLAEAFAEYLHAQSRREWGYRRGAHRRRRCIDETHRGIRPAFGYPACPDHSEKFKLFDLLGATESASR